MHLLDASIENIKAGDSVYSFNAETQEVSEQTVEEIFIHESSQLVYLNVGNETITTTPEHPFYIPQKGFVNAIDLRAGDTLWTVNGEYVIIEKIQHEILESPVKVYNFRVSNNHTYFVGNLSVGVHNKAESPNPKYKPTEYLKNHLKNGTGEITKKGINGAHNETSFLKQINDGGCKILSSTEIEPGIKAYEYQIPAKDATGAVIPDQYKSAIFSKTTYDPNVISDEVFLARGIEAFENATFNGRSFTGTDSKGLLWTGYVDSNGDITTIFPIIPEP